MAEAVRSSMITVPYEADLAVELLKSYPIDKVMGRYLLDGDDATIGFDGDEIHCLIDGVPVGKAHSFSKFVRKQKEAYDAFRSGFAEIGVELLLITGRFRKNGPEGKPLFASYMLSLFRDGKPGFLNVEAPLFEWEEAAFPGPSSVVKVPRWKKANLRSNIERASSDMMAGIAKPSCFEGIYWFAKEFRFQVP